MREPLLLDLYCCAGGAGMGYARAGFRVVGVDSEPQPLYPFDFVQADALEYLAAEGGGYAAHHASPPCQRWSEATKESRRDEHPDLIAPTRALLQATGRPYVIENVEGARAELRSPVMLCGSMFGLRVWRHRYFECPWWPFARGPQPCEHRERPVILSGRVRNGKVPNCHDKARAVGVDWMISPSQPWGNEYEIHQSIPPAYTEWIGRHLLAHLRGEVLEWGTA